MVSALSFLIKSGQEKGIKLRGVHFRQLSLIKCGFWFHNNHQETYSFHLTTLSSVSKQQQQQKQKQQRTTTTTITTTKESVHITRTRERKPIEIRDSRL